MQCHRHRHTHNHHHQHHHNHSGWSEAASKWKVSFRLVLVEVSTTMKISQFFLDHVIRNLNTDDRKEQWMQALEKKSKTEFWNRMIDKRAAWDSAFHRLVWCDIIHEELPERRPLRPHSLLLARIGNSSNVSLKRLPLAQLLTAAECARLGSIWTRFKETPFLNNLDGDAGVGPHDLRARLPRVGFAEWCEYVSEEGTPYYHNKETNEITWEKPIDARIVHTSKQGSRQSYPYPHLWREVKHNEGPLYDVF